MQLQCHELSNPEGSLKKIIDKTLFKWDAELAACPIKSSKVSIVKADGDIMDEMPFVYAWVEVKYTCFMPKPGCVVQGRVVDYSESHIDMLVYGLFNSIIRREDIKGMVFNNEVLAYE